MDVPQSIAPPLQNDAQSMGSAVTVPDVMSTPSFVLPQAGLLGRQPPHRNAQSMPADTDSDILRSPPSVLSSTPTPSEAREMFTPPSPVSSVGLQHQAIPLILTPAENDVQPGPVNTASEVAMPPSLLFSSTPTPSELDEMSACGALGADDPTPDRLQGVFATSEMDEMSACGAIGAEDASPDRLQGVFWSVHCSAAARDDKSLRDKCIALGIQVPQFQRMDPWSRRRLPPNPQNDTYKSLTQRMWENDWHDNNKGPPRLNPELAEDAHFMLRCLFRRLPLHLVTKPTNSSSNEDRFARNYGHRFATYAQDQDAVETTSNVKRIRKDAILTVLRSWLNGKVNVSGNTFQWQGFTMSPDHVVSVTAKAYADWLVGYL